MIPKTYKEVTGRLPKKHDLVYVRSQDALFVVIHIDGNKVKVERGEKGSGLFMVLPPSQYVLVEKK